LVRRRFRGAVYRISVDNLAHVNQGVEVIRVDGELLEGNLLPVFEDGVEYAVEVVLG
jgi:cellobiose phosphorylase